MKPKTLFAALYVGLQCASAIAQQAPADQPAVPPRFVTVAAIDRQKGEVTLAYHTVQIILESKGGQVVPKPVHETRSHLLSLDAAEIYNASGEKLTAEDVWKRLAVRKAIVVSGDGKKVDEIYLNALAKETLVVVSPQLTAIGTAPGLAPPGPAPR